VRANLIEQTLHNLSKPKIWNEEPVFCFTSDIDWASEDVLEIMLAEIETYELKFTTFVTHYSQLIDQKFKNRKIERGIHPNFLQNSSHGSSFTEVIENCMKFAPEAIGFRSHRLFDVTDITHLLKNNYGFKYVSNLCTVLGKKIEPFLHESGLIHFPIFFEDGTHLYNELSLNFLTYQNYFSTPGIKIISFHPMNFVLNSPTLNYMRNIKDSLSRTDYNSLDNRQIQQLQNKGDGIRDFIKDIIEFAKRKNYRILSLNELYANSIF